MCVFSPGNVTCRIGFWLSTLLIGLFFSTSIHAGQQPQPAQNDDAPGLLKEHNRLLDTAESDGEVLVIVELIVPDQDVQSVRLTQDSAHQRALDAVQQRVLDRINENRLRNAKATGLKRFSIFPGFALSVDAQSLQTLLQSSEVLRVIADNRHRPSLFDSVPLIGADIDGTFNGYTGAGQTVVVIDTGVQTDHPFLAGKTVAEACYSTTFSTGGSESVTSLCPDGATSSTAPGSSYACDPSIQGCTHGTQVAGIAVGKGEDFNGVALNASLISIQVFSQINSFNFCWPDETCVAAYDSDIIAALEHVYALQSTHRIAAINLSLGGSLSYSPCDTSPYNAIINTLRDAGIATVIASGNSGSTNAISNPACVSSAISVGSTTKTDEVSSFTNSADFLDLLAPGSSIYSSTPFDRFTTGNGTSFASPHVAGAWAVLAEAAQDQRFSVSAIENILKTTGFPITDRRSGANNRQLPRIDLQAAVYELAMSGDWFKIQADVLPSLGGYVSCKPEAVELGGNSVCIANANTDYRFSYWSGNCDGMDTICQLNNIATDQSLIAHFVPNCGTQSVPIFPGESLNGDLKRSDCIFSFMDNKNYFNPFDFQSTPGATYIIDLVSTAFDASLYLFDQSWELIAVNDDFLGPDSKIIYPALTDQRLNIYVTSHDALSTGDYTLSLSEANGISDDRCSTETLSLQETFYRGSYRVRSETTITVTAEVNTAARLMLKAPRIEFDLGFRVAAGGALTATSYPVNCADAR